MFSSLVALAALTAAMPRNLELQPVPQADIDSLNNLLSSVINTTNADLKKKLVDGQLDPLNKVLEGAVVKQKDLKICQGMVSAHYSINNLQGLSGLQIEAVTITAAETDDAQEGSLVLDIAGSINKINLSADVEGDVSAQCGILHPKAKIEGTVIADQVTVSVVAKAAAVVTDAWTINQLDVKAISLEFEDVLVHFGKFGAIFNPLLDNVLKSVEHTFKAKIEQTVDDLLRKQVQQLIKSKLPLVIKL